MCLGLWDKCDFALPLLAQEHTLCLSRHQVDPQLRAAECQQPQSLHAAARQHSHQENTDRDNCKKKTKKTLCNNNWHLSRQSNHLLGQNRSALKKATIFLDQNIEILTSIYHLQGFSRAALFLVRRLAQTAVSLFAERPSPLVCSGAELLFHQSLVSSQWRIARL